MFKNKIDKKSCILNIKIQTFMIKLNKIVITLELSETKNSKNTKINS